MTTSVPATSEGDGGRSLPDRLYTALRILGGVVLVLMLAAILYSAWIAFANWGYISV